MNKYLRTLLVAVFIGLLPLIGCSSNQERRPDAKKSGDLASIQELKKSVTAKYRELAREYNPPEARRKTVQWILDNKIVKDAGISADSSTIWLLLDSGIEFDILTN